MNGMNLEQFQFEYDLTWMSFFQNEAGRTYTRYGGRDDSDSESFLNKESLIDTMHTVLDLHKKKAVQSASRYEPIAESQAVPSDLPTMKKMMSKRKESCIHCHDVKVAELRQRHEEDSLQKQMVFTYPSPSKLGFTIDPKKQNEIENVSIASPAANAGLRTGDTILSSDGQRILTYADLTRVLEFAPKAGKLEIVVDHGNGKPSSHQVELPKGWRVSEDPSWRSSLHVVGPGGGFWGRPASEDERASLKLGPDDLALKVTFIWADHAKAAKIKLGDIVTDLDGFRENMTMRQCHSKLNLHRNWGDEITLTALRGGKPVELKMTLPSEPPWE